MVRYGGLTFGGGGPTIAALQTETVERHNWLNPTQFNLAYALSRFTPGTNVLAFCTALGWQMSGVTGAVIALIASSLPCSMVTVFFTIVLETWRDNRWVMLAIDGAAASTIGIVAGSCWHLVRPHLQMGERTRTLFLVAGAAWLQSVGVPPVRVLLLAAITGLVWRETS
jgi:chromate transporter